jgi:hypothetical protein
LGRSTIQGSGEAGAEEGVDEDGGGLRVGESFDGAGPPCPCRPGRVGAGFGQCGDADGCAQLGEHARGDIAVAAIVAGAAEDQDGVRSRQTVDRVRDRGARAVHQRIDRDAGCDHRILGRAHLGGGQHGLALDPDHEPFASGWTVAGRR